MGDTDVIIKDAELFRAGNYGPKGKYSEADLDAIVSRFEDTGIDAPITTDHKQTGPAGGWVTKVWRKGADLWGRLEINPAFADLVKERVFMNRSVELYRKPISLKAVTFLGAGAPAVKGLKPIVFSEGDSTDFETFDFAEENEGDTPRRRENEDECAMFQDGVTKRERGIDFPPRAYLFVPDAHAPSTWKLRVWEDLEKKVTRRQLGLAAAAFAPGGFRGNRVQLPANAVRTVKRRLRALYGTLGVQEQAIPAQIRNFSCALNIDGVLPALEFYEEHFALTSDLTKDNKWGLRLFSDPSGEPDPKLVGQAIAHFSPGGFGEFGYKIKPSDPGYIGAKAAIIAACEQIGKDPSWAAFRNSDIFHDPAITKEALAEARPDLIASFAEESTTNQEDRNMPKDMKELQEEVDAFKAEKTEQETKFSKQEFELETTKTKLEEKTAQFDEANGKVEAAEAEKAMAKIQTELKDRLAKVKEFSDPTRDRMTEQFKDAENLDTLDAEIEIMKVFVATFAADKTGVNENGAGESATGSGDLDSRVKTVAKKEGISYRDAFDKVAAKK